MGKGFTKLLSIIPLFILSSCGDMPIKDIESHSYRGYCKNDAGQDLSVAQCNQKMISDMPANKGWKSESDTMMKNINEDINSKNKGITSEK